ncbi:MAG: hypothetical protein AAFX03_14750 [Pseudomonadota bacterium]
MTVLIDGEARARNAIEDMADALRREAEVEPDPVATGEAISSIALRARASPSMSTVMTCCSNPKPF